MPWGAPGGARAKIRGTRAPGQVRQKARQGITESWFPLDSFGVWGLIMTAWDFWKLLETSKDFSGLQRTSDSEDFRGLQQKENIYP